MRENQEVGGPLAVVSMGNNLGHLTKLVIIRVKACHIADKALWLLFVDITAPNYILAKCSKLSNRGGLISRPETNNRRSVSTRRLLQIFCRPRADFGSDMTISRLPKLRPQVLEQSWNLNLTVKLAEQKEVVTLSLCEQRSFSSISQWDSMSRERHTDRLLWNSLSSVQWRI